ncbi:MAG: type V CRISPR-associated protein Cas12d [Parcubacteria group bacterium]|nr:type V CRISPR-associated protein Cas12d [Parcubacteria group bacterium]
MRRMTEAVYAVEADAKKNLALEWFGYDPTPNLEYAYSAFVHPDIPFRSDASAKELLFAYRDMVTRVHPDLYGATGDNTDEVLKKVFGLFNNHGAFSSYFNKVIRDLRTGGDAWEEAIVSVSPYWEKHRNELHTRIAFLAEKVSILPESRFVTGWHNYRSSVGGKIESWVSNVVRQEKDIRDQLFGKVEVIQKGKEKGKERKILGHIQVLTRVIGDPVFSQDVHLLAEDCGRLLERMKSGVNDSDLSLYRSMLGDLRISMNVAYQGKYPFLDYNTEKERKKEEKEKRAHMVYAPLYADVKLVPNFLGDSKREVYAKFIRSAEILKTGVNYINEVDMICATATLSPRFEDSSDAIEFVLKQYEMLRKKYHTLTSTRFLHVIEGLFRHVEGEMDGEVCNVLEKVQTKDEQGRNPYVFFRSSFARTGGRVKKIELPGVTADTVPNILDEMITALKPRWEDILAQGNVHDMVDAVEMEKVRIGILSALYYDVSVTLRCETLPEELFSSAHALSALKGHPDTLSGNDFGRFIQTGILTEMKGAVTKMSRTEFVERYVAQIVGSEKEFPLCARDGQWYIAQEKPTKKEEGSMVEVKDGKVFDGTHDTYTSRYIDSEELLPILSSRYHMQFLKKTRLVNGVSWWEKKGMRCSLGEYSFIAERTVNLLWNMQKNTLQAKEKDDSKRVFVSVPFSLSSIKKEDNGVRLSDTVRYMGIDVGEYGLAWTIIDADTKTKKVTRIVKHGFIHEPLTHHVREYVSVLKQNQIKGTFGMPNTKLERLRENAIGSLRNKVHSIVIRYDAVPVYEFEISNFETGSKRVTVLYNSVKRADVGRGGSEADKAEVDLVWGKKGKNIGKQIGAYGTSYICSRCGYSPYDASLSREDLHTQKEKSRPSLKDFLETRSEFKHFSLQKDGKYSGEWKERRGNSAIYVCQKCGHVSDADMQASYRIAAKRFAKDMYEHKKEEDSTALSFEDIRSVHTFEDNHFMTRLDIKKM